MGRVLEHPVTLYLTTVGAGLRGRVCAVRCMYMTCYTPSLARRDPQALTALTPLPAHGEYWSTRV